MYNIVTIIILPGVFAWYVQIIKHEAAMTVLFAGPQVGDFAVDLVGPEHNGTGMTVTEVWENLKKNKSIWQVICKIHCKRR